MTGFRSVTEHVGCTPDRLGGPVDLLFALVYSVMWHVSSASNRASIDEFGLDWTRMGAARGIAGSTCPENDGIFLGDGFWDAHYFCEMNNTGGPVDVWAAAGVDADDLLDNGSGYFYLPRRIARQDIELRYSDVLLQRWASGSFSADDLRLTLEPFRHHADGRIGQRERRRGAPR